MLFYYRYIPYIWNTLTLKSYCLFEIHAYLGVLYFNCQL